MVFDAGSAAEGGVSSDAGFALDGSDGQSADSGARESPDGSLDGSTEGDADASMDGGLLCDGGQCASRCDLTGTYALKLTAPARWPATGQLSSGGGTFEFRLRLLVVHADNQVSTTLQECKQKVPAVHAALANEDHLLTYPDSLYDGEKLPISLATMTLGDSTVSSSLSLTPVAMEMGVDLTDPLNDAWPSSAAGLSSTQRVDVEGDGNPSVTALHSNMSGYVYPRTSTSPFSQRAQQVYIAGRWVFFMSGTLTSCDGAAGSVTVSKLDSRILGCRHPDGSLCTASEASYLDSNLPQFQFGVGTYVLRRVATGASCAAVRAVP